MMNVFDFALEMEAESRVHYEKLAAAAKSKELQTIFTLLADSEREHYEHLSLLKGGTDAKKARSVALEQVKEGLHELMESLPAADILESDFDGYRHAIGTEEASIKLYDELADKETNPAAAELLRRLAEEERHHLKTMENIYDFVEGPRTYLEWGEFSNLREY